mgnify:CR=1
MSSYAICVEHVVKYTRLWRWIGKFHQIVIEMKTSVKERGISCINGLKP